MELSDVLHVKTSDGAAYDFEVVGIVEDPDAAASYAVLWHEGTGNGEGQFIVTDSAGNILEDEELAQHVLDEFLDYAEEENE
ncbi:MAG TPA: hypothetical protein VIW73_12600 [Candidatus Cybelea sp.]